MGKSEFEIGYSNLDSEKFEVSLEIPEISLEKYLFKAL